MSDVTDRVERRLREDHADLLAAVSTCADAVAAEWDRRDGDARTGEASGDARTADSSGNARTADRDAVVPAFERALDASGVLAHLPTVLSDLVSVTGRPMPAPPVAAPPYVVVTSEGVVLRASLGDSRLVVSLDVFAVERGDGARYVRRDGVDVRVERRR